MGDWLGLGLVLKSYIHQKKSDTFNFTGLPNPVALILYATLISLAYKLQK